jgi:hypothetical protein
MSEAWERDQRLQALIAEAFAEADARRRAGDDPGAEDWRPQIFPVVEQAFEALRAAAGDKLDGLDVEAHRRAVWGEGE